MAAASVAVPTFWELLRGDAGLPRLLGEGLEAAPSGSRKWAPAPKPAAHLTLPSLRRPLVGVPLPW